jgi:hypothetical protein
MLVLNFAICNLKTSCVCICSVGRVRIERVVSQLKQRMMKTESKTVRPNPSPLSLTGGACSHVRFWNEPTAYTPESRTEVHQYMAEKRKKERAKSPEYVGSIFSRSPDVSLLLFSFSPSRYCTPLSLFLYGALSPYFYSL